MCYRVIQTIFFSNGPAAMKSTVTVRLDEDLDRELAEVSDALGQSRSEIVRDALRRQLSVLRFEELREQVMPFAEARGYLTDEDVFEEVS
jgi:predicted transcriptional regulator